jgi:hypothetical protein
MQAMPGVIDLRERQPSRTGAAIDAATRAFQIWAASAQQKQEEQKAVDQLVPYLSGLDDKTRGPLMAKLASENPRIFQAVAQRIGNTSSSSVDPEEAARQQGLFAAIGYNPNSTIHMDRATPPPEPAGPLGMLGPPQIGNPLGVTASTMAPVTAPPYDPNKAVAPTAPGYGELPKDPIERAHMLSARDVYSLGKETAGPSWVEMNRGRALPGDEQANANRVTLQTAPTANVVTTQAGEAARNAATVGASKERTSAYRERTLSQVERDAGKRDSSMAELQRLQKKIDDNQKEIRRIQMAASKDPLVQNTADAQISQLNRASIAAKAQMDQIRAGQPARPTTSTQKAAAPNQYGAQAEAAIQAGMNASGGPYPREVVIAMLKKDPRTAGLFQ